MGTIADKLAYLQETTDLLKSIVEESGVTIPEGATLRDYVLLLPEAIGSNNEPGEPATYTLFNQDGSQITAVEIDEEVVFTATEDDIREGAVAATASGLTIGTAKFPTYHTAVIDTSTGLCTGVTSMTDEVSNPALISIPVCDSNYVGKYHINGAWYEDDAGTIPWESSQT